MGEIIIFSFFLVYVYVLVKTVLCELLFFVKYIRNAIKILKTKNNCSACTGHEGDPGMNGILKNFTLSLFCMVFDHFTIR